MRLREKESKSGEEEINWSEEACKKVSWKTEKEENEVASLLIKSYGRSRDCVLRLR